MQQKKTKAFKANPWWLIALFSLSALCAIGYWAIEIYQYLNKPTYIDYSQLELVKKRIDHIDARVLNLEAKR